MAQAAAVPVTADVALLSSLVDSLVDAAAALVSLLAVRYAATPADREHRFGHGKAEPLAALVQSAFLAGGALLLLVSMALTAGLVAYQRHVVRETGSLAINADELHYRSDLILNAGVIATLAVESAWDVPLLDPLFGGAVGLWIIRSAVAIARLSAMQLMDRELPDTEREHIRAIAQAEPGVVAAHHIRTRVAGPTTFIQLHIDIDGATTLSRAHDIADAVEGRLRHHFPRAEIFVHQEPAAAGA
jgi:ferrous-iron efflux pump FieF